MNKTNLYVRELEEKSLLNAVCVLIDWSILEKVDISLVERMDVATRLWITISFTFQSKEHSVSGSSIQIAKQKLFKLLDELGVK